jgi:hypothetical protein
VSGSTVWPAIVAAVVVGLFTGPFTLIAVLLQYRATRRDTRDEQKRQAYGRLLAASGAVGMTANTLHTTMTVRSGLGEGLDVALRLRRPADPMDLHTFMRPDFDALYAALADVWIVGSPRSVALANALMQRVGDVIASHTVRGEQRRSAWRWVAGDAWTGAQRAQMAGDLAALAIARRDLADLARTELGHETAELFTPSND